MDILSVFQYSFIQNAFLAGSFVALTCSALGIFLVLRKISLIGDGLSHVSFGAIAVGLFFGIYPMYAAIPIVIIASIFILKITEKATIYGDAAIGIVSSLGIASGVILASLSNGFSVDLFSYLFGSILAISTEEVIISIVLSSLVLLMIYLFYWELFSTTFDENFAKVSGIKTDRINYILTILTAITIVISVKVVGIMLVSSLIIIPAITALQVSKRFIHALIISGVISVLSVFIGIITSFIFDIPTGATIVIINIFFFAISLAIRKFA